MQLMATRVRKESYTVDYAGFWIRFWAFLIDTLIIVGISLLYNGIWGLASGAGFWGEEATDPLLPDAVASSGSSLWAVSSGILFLIVVAYFICFWRWRGQTPGKMIMRLKIVHFNGAGMGWGGAVMRFLGYIISILLVLSGFFWIPVDIRRQGFHDKIADTFVIAVPRKRSAADGASRYKSEKAYEASR
ncbi:MAG TPA: RDD family protein [Dehalococcoidia bacterium]|nr:RDD family protein [Dehalococcoidia bacterium]